MQEAVGQGTDLIVAYHPPIFAPLNRITQKWVDQDWLLALYRLQH